MSEIKKKLTLEFEINENGKLDEKFDSEGFSYYEIIGLVETFKLMLAQNEINQRLKRSPPEEIKVDIPTNNKAEC